MVLTFVGLGLGDVEDVSLKGYKAIKEADLVYLEIYTSLLIDSTLEDLEAFYGKKIKEAHRIVIEEENDQIIDEAKNKNVVILISGDPFSATTHCELYHKAMGNGLDVRVIHNASIMNSIGVCGLQLYRFGETVSIPFFDDKWRPFSFYDKIVNNRRANLHTLCLLDIKIKERSIENLMNNKMIFEPPRFMTINVAIKQIIEVDHERKELDVDNVIGIGIARLGSKNKVIKSGKLKQLLEFDFGVPLHSLIICSHILHDIETNFINFYKN